MERAQFFKRPIPRSAWRLDLGSSYLDRQMEEFSHLSAGDLLATLTEFAAYAITRSITDNVKMLSEISVIMASGRGTRNHYLMSRLREYMPKGRRLTTSDEFGVPAQFRERSSLRRLPTPRSTSSPTTYPLLPARPGSESLASWCSCPALQRE
ncbi:hypothetical protein HGP14_31135 [Rhizobium sp. P32RR-XVIII]|uniref:anhydro-N-acetylmuramic acid kinase n=1 Tax=Rhizobium sp. P32RR-XVIII TaxID=2726738 RepID=UPI00145711D0|nr:hypothetical protein [Rhizobium sp. P32RR-XVIII]